MITEFLRAQAGWRLTHAERDPVRTARCAAALLDAAAFAAKLPDSDPDLAALASSGCFRGDVFDPGPKGISLARSWQFGDGAVRPPARPDLRAGAGGWGHAPGLRRRPPQARPGRRRPADPAHVLPRLA